MKRWVLQGIGVLRWLAWAMLVANLAASWHLLSRPGLAFGVTAAALAVNLVTTWKAYTDPERLTHLAGIAVELFVGLSICLADGWAYRSGHAFSTAQSLGGAWPLAGVLTAGVALGPLGGIVAGLAIGAARAGAVFANGIPPAHIESTQLIAMLTTAGLYMIAGGVIGHISGLLERAEKNSSAARAREEIARTLHDGVLQTLAIVERSTDDPSLARLAREQERELREFLFGSKEPIGSDTTRLVRESRRGRASACAVALRSAGGKFERAFDAKAQIVVAEDLPTLKPEVVNALAGAVGEALTNAGKHGGARHVTVYVEPDDDRGIFCSVKDDGSGFDTQETPEGFGLKRSIRARIAEVGGTVELDSVPGGGTEVRFFVQRGLRG